MPVAKTRLHIPIRLLVIQSWTTGGGGYIAIYPTLCWIYGNVEIWPLFVTWQMIDMVRTMIDIWHSNISFDTM